jgi:hypothetical protein
MLRASLLAIFVVSLYSHGPAAEIDFVRDVRPILRQHCYPCHGATKQKSGLRLDVKAAAFNGGDGYGASVIAGSADDSPLIQLVTAEDESSRMPPDGEPLSAEDILTLTRWIDDGAIWPDGIDLAKLEDRLDHWSFHPVALQKIPAAAGHAWPRGAIDRFELARLHDHGLKPAADADDVAWLRRVTFDLTGLPPTPSEVTAFQRAAQNGEPAFAKVVDRLLASPNYGERWAQHWLDVVRYADTHGFEVNTERPNAWPYRDYVIAALNDDIPYDRFVREQIVGDAMGADVATGFLVTASVLLPGQIGQDAPSMRLARQDALDEIVNNIGQTFLGLSVGCARCHDHKFDPISAADYYAMQAFVAGVEYGDREVHSNETEALRKETESLRKQIAAIDLQLADFVPLARPLGDRSSEFQATNAIQNDHEFSPLDARFVRFTIHDSNRHPSLGLIEPCIDEFEIFTDQEQPRNIALASCGTKVTASGSRTSSNHQLQHIHDGRYGNDRSWMADTVGHGWVMFQLPEVARIAKVVWGRDRNGVFTDRLPTAFTLEAGMDAEHLVTLVDVPALRPEVHPRVNTDRFLPVMTKRIRFTVLATNGLEPCIDELEVYNTAGQNIALASLGTVVATSGSNFAADRHEPRFIHDGRYGNSSSWMSNTSGTCWVELEFADRQEIERVVWGRDRQGEFADRLATQYAIEIEQENEWRRVADSSDRRPWSDSDQAVPVFTTAGLPVEQARQADRLLTAKQKLQTQIEAAEAGQRAFAGIFRQPDEIHLLRRGDPEQPEGMVSPAVLSAVGDLSLPNSTPEQGRRAALADWIADPENPLTARVMANRIWQWHFGVGLVETANDFGRNGASPSHPELLDWLAQELIRSGWSIKRLHRLIVLSSTYRQATESSAEGARVDADVRLLWRYPTRRLEAEAIRDAMLVASGRMNWTMGGRGFDLFDRRGGLTGFTPIESFTGQGLRRMIYAHKVRRERDAVFGAFDCPDAGQSTPRRVESTTPLQALNLFNSQITIDLADAFAARIIAEVGDDPGAQIRRAYEIALNRIPGSDEVADVEPMIRQHGLPTLCRVLFNSNEFLFLP